MNSTSIRIAACCVIIASVVAARSASAHCDGLDGPVVAAARRALETGDVKPALIWVQKRDEAEIAHAFARAKAVRELGAGARELADLYFFETLVRVHRAGEGAPYTGLKPAGRDLGPAIPAADRALETADLRVLSQVLDGATKSGLSERFRLALEAKRRAGEGVEAGRRHVSAYVEFIHYAEGIYEAATRHAHVHVEEASPTPVHAH